MKKQKTVTTPENPDMNNGLPPEQQKDEPSDFLPMDDDIFDDLPPLLHAACDQLTDREEQETFLIGALGVLSGMLPNVQSTYFKRKVYPNLYVFIMGKYGTGKGALLWAKDLGEAVDAHRKQQCQEAIARYAEEEAQYHRQQKLYDKGKLPDPPQPPKQPKHLKLYLPANSTKTALMQLLMENDGRGVIFETEGDTLADMLKQDYGNFSDVLRKAFHHEPVSYFRRANNEDVDIKSPALSVVLSGTQDQLRRLIPSIENGLFSRFMFYELQGCPRFKNPFDASGDDQEYYFARLSERFLGMYRRLEAQEEPVWFKLQAHQQEAFTQHFDELKQEIHHHISHDLDGTINRQGLITYRIAMILTAIRFIDSLHGTLTCLDTDFNNAIAIARHMLHYSLHVYEGLRKTKKEIEQEIEIENKKEKIEEACRCRSMGMKYAEIALQILGKETKGSTIWGWVKQYCKQAG